jgi:anti-sigma factor RsiW
MMNAKLTERELADLSAWMDGELTGPAADEVTRRLADDPRWQQAHAELQALNALLDSWAAPAPPEGLAQRIIGQAAVWRRTYRSSRWRWLVPAAAAAAVLVATIVYRAAGPVKQTPAPQVVDRLILDLPDRDQFVVENLEFFQNYQTCGVLADNEALLTPETLEAIDALESKGT